jgi:hypothetical protein
MDHPWDGNPKFEFLCHYVARMMLALIRGLKPTATVHRRSATKKGRIRKGIGINFALQLKCHLFPEIWYQLFLRGISIEIQPMIAIASTIHGVTQPKRV